MSAASDGLVLFIYALNVLQTDPLTATLQNGGGWARGAELHRPGAPINAMGAGPGMRPRR